MKQFMDVDEFARRARAGEFASKDAGAVLRPTIAPAAIDEASRTITYVISDATVDRSKDVLRPEGGRFDNYRKNPVFLFAHDYGRMPIGECVKMPWVEEGKIKASFLYYDADTNPEADTAWKIAKRGTGMCAVSVGFVPLKWSFNEVRGGIDFDEWELIEVSQVPVPCNPSAVQDGKSLADAQAFIKSICARARQEKSVPETKTVRLTITASEGDIASLEKLAGSVGTVRKDDDGDNDAEGEAMATGDAMAKHVKALGEMCAVVGQHVKAIGQHRDATAAAMNEAQAHAKTLGEHVKALTEGSIDGGDGKGASGAVTKGGAPHKLSSANLKDAQAAHGALTKMLGRHKGEADGEGDDDGDETASDKPKKSALDIWLADVKAAGGDPKAALDALLKTEAARASGRLD